MSDVAFLVAGAIIGGLMTTDNEEGDDEPSELLQKFTEAQVLFPSGLVVQLKSGGPKMTVQRCYIYDDGEDEGVMVDCLWFNSSYNPGVLSTGGPTIEYSGSVQQFDFSPDVLTAIT
jgi:uncharacterized protein YodC (DUF2158 family)